MLLLAVAVIYVVYQMYKNYTRKEGFESGDDEKESREEPVEMFENEESQSADLSQLEMMTSRENPVERDMRNAQMMGMGGDQLSAQDLLPQDKSSTWASVNPEGQGTLDGKNFLQSGYHIGINTVGQTLRNANLQLRSEPPNPQVQVSPWLQTTIEPDVSRRPMEIGGCQ